MFVTWSDLYNAGPSTPPVSPPTFVMPEAPTDGELYGRQSAAWAVIPPSVYNEIWDWTTKTANATNKGEVGIDTASWTTAAHLNLNTQAANGRDMTQSFDLFKVGNEVVVQLQSDSTRQAKYSITSAGVNNGTWYQFGISMVTSGGALPGNNAPVLVAILVTTTGGGGGGDMLKSVYDTNADNIVDHAALADTAPWTGISGKPASFTPAAHATTHESGGSDSIPLDTLGAPTDITTLNVSTTAHGLCPKAPGTTTTFLRGDATFAALPGAAVSTDAGNLAVLGTDNLILVPRSTIELIRLRSFNAVGNPNFEVDQRNVHTGLTNPISATMVQDRWQLQRVGATFALNTSPAVSPSGQILLPGTNFAISHNYLALQLTTQQATLAAGDYIMWHQAVEGPLWRELSSDVHSLSLLVRSSVAGLKFSVCLRDFPTTAYSLVKLITIPTANVFTLIQLPNIPVWPTAGNFTALPGSSSYALEIVLACGTTYTAPAADTWQSGNFIAAPGMSNFAAQAVNSTFDIAFCQHEPGSQCTTLIDKPFSQNYDECLRYYAKSYDYGTSPGTIAYGGATNFVGLSAAGANGSTAFPKRMAQVPTAVTIYDPNNGAANSAFNNTASTHATVSGGFVSQAVIGQISGSGYTAGHLFLIHYTADTGW